MRCWSLSSSEICILPGRICGVFGGFLTDMKYYLTNLYYLFSIGYGKYMQEKNRVKSNAVLSRQNRRAVKSSASNVLCQLSNNSRLANLETKTNKKTFLFRLSCIIATLFIISKDIKKAGLYLFTVITKKIAVGWNEIISPFLLQSPGIVSVGGIKLWSC